MMLNLQKGAMFGLDARIALAIFGALSIISGAALYSAIQAAKAEQLNQYFLSYHQASDAYYLDTAEQLQINGLTEELRLGSLYNDTGSPYWKGPYVTGVDFAVISVQDNMTDKFKGSASLYMYIRKNSTWSPFTIIANNHKCASKDPDCGEWLALRVTDADDKATLLEMFKGLDKLVDNGDGELEGTVRYDTYGALLYKGRPRVKP